MSHLSDANAHVPFYQGLFSSPDRAGESPFRLPSLGVNSSWCSADDSFGSRVLIIAAPNLAACDGVIKKPAPGQQYAGLQNAIFAQPLVN